MKSFLAVLLLVTTATGTSNVAEYTVEDVNRHRAWQSMYIHDEGLDGYGRALVSAADGRMSLAIDLPVGACDRYIPRLILGGNEPAPLTGEFKVDKMYGRVDRRPIHTLSADTYFQKGVRHAVLRFRPNDIERFWREIRGGQMFRVKIEVISDTKYETFTLNGSANALSRAKRICRTHSPKSYFKKDEILHEEHPEAEYF